MYDAREQPTSLLLVAEDGSELALWRLPERAPDLTLVDGLLRLQLHACRQGRRLRVRGARRELRDLVELLGLEDVLALEPRREAEVRELLGADEVVQGDDPIA